MVYTPPKYPGAIPTITDLPNRVDDIDWLLAARYNELKKELRAALIELGILPKGSHADVKTRLDEQQHKIIDDDGDSYEDVEKTADVDEAVTYLKNILVRKFNDDGILDLPKQSRARAGQLAASQQVPTITSTKVVLESEVYDNQNEFDPAANYRFTAKKAGYYLIAAAVRWVAVSDAKRYTAHIYKNGAEVTVNEINPGVAGFTSNTLSDIIYLAANDYVELFCWHNKGVNEGISNAVANTFMAIHKLS